MLSATVMGGLLAISASAANAGAAVSAATAARAATAFTEPAEAVPQLAQYYRGRGYYGRPAPRYYAAPAWGYRPWYRRPYYGTIIGGIALGTIIGVTAYGLAPPRPRPDMCWYWADEMQSRGYWDYC